MLLNSIKLMPDRPTPNISRSASASGSAIGAFLLCVVVLAAALWRTPVNAPHHSASVAARVRNGIGYAFQAARASGSDIENLPPSPGSLILEPIFDGGTQLR